MKTLLTTTAFMLAAAVAHAQELTVGVANMSSYLEPGTDHSNVGSQYYVNTFETLLGKDPFSSEAKFAPLLATSWELLGPRRARLTIREDVKFHNGDDMTIEDVLFSFQAMMNVTHPARIERSR
ncbi:MAG: ABC transporter substrate-binding protein, partial [Pseudomonadota bacterium]